MGNFSKSKIIIAIIVLLLIIGAIIFVVIMNGKKDSDTDAGNIGNNNVTNIDYNTVYNEGEENQRVVNYNEYSQNQNVNAVEPEDENPTQSSAAQ